MRQKRKRKPRELAKKGLDVFMNWLKNQKPQDLAEIGLMGGLAFLGWRNFRHWSGALVGPIALKLATTQGGTPPVAQITGIASLAVLGVSGFGHGMPPEEWRIIPPQPVKQPDPQKAEKLISPDFVMGIPVCRKGFHKVTPWPGVIMCEPE